MKIIISNIEGRPIYEQIYEQIKSEIIKGNLKEGDMLPSMRGLAKDLKISIITTKRAYEELEKNQYIYTVAGKGCYVKEKNFELIKENYLLEIENHFKEIINIAGICEIKEEELYEIFKALKGEK